MTAADKSAYRTGLLGDLSKRVVWGEGAAGTRLQAADPSLDGFVNSAGCVEVLNDTRPDADNAKYVRLQSG